MSSAAVQSSGTALAANRQYQQSSHGREQYYGQQSPIAPSASSPASSRRPRQSNTSPLTPQQAQFAAGSAHSPQTANTTPRNIPLPPSAHGSPASPQVNSSQHPSNGGPPIAPPPRTSSQAHQTNSTDHSMPHSSGPSRSSQHHTSGHSDRDRAKDDSATSAANAAQSRRRGHGSSANSPRQQRSSDAARSRHSPGQSRSASAVASPPTLPREDSTVISRVVVTDPNVDVARERARQNEARPMPPGAEVKVPAGLGLHSGENAEESARPHKSRQDHSKSGRKETRFGDYILGQTLGEGEFGKVKMGWKKEGGIQVAIKLIRRETLGSNPSRLPKIYREIAILRELQHPNIVRLHEMVETERHIGIILEYASGGELFDYILNHRYLKDGAARRLFAQLVSGVGYLHKKGIVHRDLKLENLLLDRNRNIIITDFGFANTFDPLDDLGEEIEYNLTNREFVKKMGLEQTKENGHRRGDLMQTSCGSPCYAAPELVVSDSLYTGRKVDVWSCGVILYAMLAGYLPFDDDPANPEGDNINLLYKYIVSTPLTFPEYVTPHARDLLKRILVPDPRKRADLWEVARHSWLSEYSHVVSFITSDVTTESDIVGTTIGLEQEPPSLARSASVREAGKAHSTVMPVGGLGQKHGHIDSHEQNERQKSTRDAKRRTVQVEYVAPHSQTQRGETSPPMAASTDASGKTRARQDHGPVEVPPPGQNSRSQYQRASAQAPTRPGRDTQRSVSDSTAFGNVPHTSSSRPATGGTLGSRLPSRGNSYGQPAAATVANTNAQGHLSQPNFASSKSGKQYQISGPIPNQQQNDSFGHPSTHQVPAAYEASVEAQNPPKGHKRSNTIGGIADKLFGRGGSTSSPQRTSQQPSKRYPPTSMSGPMYNKDNESPAQPRASTDSRRSFGFSRKTSDINSSNGREGRSSRRFSLLPASFSMRNFTSGSHRASVDPPGSSYSNDPRRTSNMPPSTPRSRQQARPSPTGMAFGQGQSRSPSQSTTGSAIPVVYDSALDRRPIPTSAPAHQTQFSPQSQSYPDRQYNESYRPPVPPKENYENYENQDPRSQQRNVYPPGFNGEEAKNSRGVLHKNNRRFNDAYEAESGPSGHSGSSGAARRVMDLFRRRGKARDDR